MYHGSTAAERRIKTGIEGLDTILKGGLLATETIYPSVILTGPPGAGKSILGLAIAAGFARENSSALVVLNEEQPSDFSNVVQRLHLAQHGMMLVNDGQYRMRAGELLKQPCASGKMVFSFYPEAALGVLDHSLTPANPTLGEHICERLDAMRPPCKVVVVDSLWGVSRLEAQTQAMQDPVNDSLERQRVDFKELCELSSRKQVIFITIIENETGAAPDWREFVADVVIRFHIEAGLRHRMRRFVQVVKTRYQANLDGYHAFEINDDGVKIFPNGFALLDQLQHPLDRPVSSTSQVAVKPPVKFSVEDSFNRFIDDGIAEGSAILIYGDDQTRKRLTAVRFLQQALIDDACSTPLVVCVGADKNAFERVLQKYWTGPRGPITQVRIIEGPSDGSWDDTRIEQFISRLNEEIKTAEEHPSGAIPIMRAVVDDVAAVSNWSQFVPPLKQLFAAHGITSLFVHTLEREEQHQHRVMFDTIIRTKRFTRMGKTQGPFVAYHKTKENSVSPKDQSWWKFEWNKVEEDGEVAEEIELRSLGHHYLTRDGELSLPRDEESRK